MVCCTTLWWDCAGKGRGWKTAAIIYCWQQQRGRGRTVQLSDISGGATCVADLDSRALALTKEASGNSRASSSNVQLRQSEDQYFLCVHAGLFWCFHNPPNSDVDCRICNVRMWSFCMYILGVPRFFCPIWSTFVESAQSLTPKNSQGKHKA